MSEQMERSALSESLPKQQEKLKSSLQNDDFAAEHSAAAAAVVGSALGIHVGSEMGRAVLAGGNQLMLNIADFAPQNEVSDAPQICFSQNSPVNDFQAADVGAGAVSAAFTAQAVGVSDAAAL